MIASALGIGRPMITAGGAGSPLSTRTSRKTSKELTASKQDISAACLEAELLTDVQQRLVLLSRNMDNQNGQRVPYQPALSRS